MKQAKPKKHETVGYKILQTLTLNDCYHQDNTMSLFSILSVIYGSRAALEISLHIGDKGEICTAFEEEIVYLQEHGYIKTVLDDEDEENYYLAYPSALQRYKPSIKAGFTFITMLISIIAAIIGIIFFYQGNTNVTIICAAVAIVDSIIQFKWGGLTSFFTIILASVIGIIVASFTKSSTIDIVSVAICMETSLLSLFSVFAILAKGTN